jgi:hypothetical protein
MFYTFRCRWLTPVILVTWEPEIRGIKVQGQPGQIVDKTPISKITKAKWTGGVAQAVDCLLCKHEAVFKFQSHTQKKECSICGFFQRNKMLIKITCVFKSS